MIFGILLIFGVLQASGIINISLNRINNTFFVRYNTTFDLIDESTHDSSCKFPPWGGCSIKNISFDKNYIQKEKNKLDGVGCYIKKIHRFKGTKRGYTKINTEGSCDYDKTYRILIY